MSSPTSLLERLAVGRREVRYRWMRYRQARRFPRVTPADCPIVFLNAFPKSGTHLLRQILHGLSDVGPFVPAAQYFIPTYAVASGRKREPQEIESDLQALRPGDIQMGHLHATPSNVAFLTQPGTVAFFAFRDLRDVVVSHAFFVTDMAANHVHHQYYAGQASSMEERIRISILGRPELTAIEFPDIRARFDPFLGWLDVDEVLALRYEALLDRREEQLRRIWRHVQRAAPELGVTDDRALAALARGIDPRRSPTFRAGKAGGWREYFSEANKALFKDVAGDLLVRLGYERDLDW